MTTALFDRYRQGIAALIETLGRDHPQVKTAYVYQQRLTENLDRATLYGDTDTLKAERAEILDRCNQLSLATMGKPFTDFCPSPASPSPLPHAAPASKYTIHIDGGQVGAIGDNAHIEGGIHFGDKDET